MGGLKVLALVTLFWLVLPVTIAGANDRVYFFHNDHLGTPQAMTDLAGRTVWTAEYEPFGKAVIDQDPDGDGRQVVNNLRFPGQYYDAETGLHYNWHRDYDPETGRYLQPDPIGLEGGTNLYAYALENPIMYSDPTGEIVKLCKRALDGWPFRAGPFHHAYLDVNGSLYGFHFERWLIDNGRVENEKPGRDISFGGPLNCVDDSCVLAKIALTTQSSPGYSFGFYDCRAWAKMIILLCHKKDCCEN